MWSMQTGSAKLGRSKDLTSLGFGFNSVLGFGLEVRSTGCGASGLRFRVKGSRV